MSGGVQGVVNEARRCTARHAARGDTAQEWHAPAVVLEKPQHCGGNRNCIPLVTTKKFVTVSITYQKVSCLLMVCCLREYHLTSTVGVTRGLGRARPEDQADTAGTTVVRSYNNCSAAACRACVQELVYKNEFTLVYCSVTGLCK